MDILNDFINNLFDLSLLDKYEKIYCLVSGGVDSTLLYHVLKRKFGDKVFPLNCFNPFEANASLDEIKKDKNFIQIHPEKGFIYGEILKDAFKKLPIAFEARVKGKYNKKIFSCCYYIKHKSFLNNPIFQQKGTVIISGIKRGDGRIRQFWLYRLHEEKTFFHVHDSGQEFCYPFRDYMKREFPKRIMIELRNYYPNLKHSGCSICPVLVLFEVKDENRYERSIRYAKNILGEDNYIFPFCKRKLSGRQKKIAISIIDSKKEKKSIDEFIEK